MKINKDVVVLDIETSYTLSATWGIYDTNAAMVIREPYIISFSWKYLGDKKTTVVALPDFPLYKKDKHNDRDIIKYIWKVLDDAKIVVAHNGNSFDYKWIYGRFAVHEITPPSPCSLIDTLLISRRKFKFNSNRLKDLGNYFNIGSKVETGGISLWYKCVELGDVNAWKQMKKYNKQDVVLLENVYYRLLPYTTNHPNIALINNEKSACPNCGSLNVERRGFNYSRVGKNQRWQCKSCGSWHQSSLSGGQIK